MVLEYFLKFASLASASSFVLPITVVTVTKNLRLRGFRPLAAAAARILATFGATAAGECPPRNMASA